MSRTIGFALLISVLAGSFAGAAAQVFPPLPGVSVPDAYFERRLQDPRAFTFRRAWKQQTEIVREKRRQRDLGYLSSAESVESDFRVQGIRRVPVLAGRFADTGDAPYTTAQLQERLFDGPNPTGTVTDYYAEVSYGLLQLTGTVYGETGDAPYLLSGTAAEYDRGCNGLCPEAGTGNFLKELLDGADPDIDFGDYDNDGPDGIPNSGDDDGFVDFVAFVHSERGGECGTSNLWSHRWSYEAWWGESYITEDAAWGGGRILVSDYTIQPMVSCNGSSLIEIGVFAHEFGHAFGLPDLYDTNTDDGNSSGIGNWCLMATGSSGGDGVHPSVPAHLSAWCKEQLGWMEPRVVCETGTGFSLGSAATTGECLKIYPKGLPDTEYFLIENRVQTGFDKHLYTSGLAIWHIDNDEPGNGNELRKLVDLEEADGRADLDATLNRGDLGDLFPGNSGNREFSDDTNPSARDNQGEPTGFAVTAIDDDVGNRSFDLEISLCRLRIHDVAVGDFESGNNNRALDPGEAAELRVCLVNDFDLERRNLTARLTALTEGVVVTRSVAAMPDFSGVSPGCETPGIFSIEVPLGLAPGTSLDFQIDVTGENYASSDVVTMATGGYVLLVEDDGAADNSAYYLEALVTGAYTIRHTNAADRTPTLSELQSALAVIWYTGGEFLNTLSPGEQTVLSEYLDGGGALCLIGQDLGFDLVSEGSPADKSFYREYLRALFIADSALDNDLDGIPGDPIGDGLSLFLTAGAANSDFPSEIAPRDGAITTFEYAPGKAGAIRYAGEYRLAYFAFNLEAAAEAPRREVLARTLDWLIPTDQTPPTVALLGPAGGTEFEACQTVNVTWAADDASGVDEIDVLFAFADGPFLPMATALANTGSYVWERTDRANETFRVRVKARDPRGLQGVATSAEAMVWLPDVESPVVTVVSPNGGESFTVGDAVPVRWTVLDDCFDLGGTTRVQVSLDDGETWSLIAESALHDTTVVWTADTTASAVCRVRVLVEDQNANLGEGISESAFTLASNVPGAEQFLGATRPVLLPNYPNPFPGPTQISFFLPEPAGVTVDVFDLRGRRVRRVVEDRVEAGPRVAVWDGLTDDGRPSPAGIYFLVLHAGDTRLVRKLVKTGG